MEYYSAIKKKENLPLVATWVNLEGVILGEVSQTEKDKYCTISLIYGIKNKQKNPTSEAHRNREQTGGCKRWGVVGEMDRKSVV